MAAGKQNATKGAADSASAADKVLSTDTVLLRSSDGEEFEVSDDVAFLSGTIQNLVEDTGCQVAVPLPNVRGAVLARIIEFGDYHARMKKKVDKQTDDIQKAALEKEVAEWDKKFIDVDQAVLYELIQAANYLNFKLLLDLCCQTVANIIKGKTAEEIRAYFHIKNDFTPEEEEEVRRENQWAFE